MKRKLDIIDIMRIWVQGSIVIGASGYIILTFINHSNPITWIFSIGLFSYLFSLTQN
jgi:hypothetical protein